MSPAQEALVWALLTKKSDMVKRWGAPFHWLDHLFFSYLCCTSSGDPSRVQSVPELCTQRNYITPGSD